MEHHPIHLHGFYWKITEMDGLQLPEAAQQPGNTVLVAVGQTRTVEFIADNPGDWTMHCHMTHHTMNQMWDNAPNLIGVRAGGLDKRVSTFLRGYMTMGESGMADMGEMSMRRGHLHSQVDWASRYYYPSFKIHQATSRHD